MRILALDYGEKTVGTAVSDALFTVATPLEVIRRDRESMLRKTLARIEEICGAEGIGLIVLGLPLHMSGAESKRSEMAREFGDRVMRRTGLPVALQDERLSSVEAEEWMRADGLEEKERKAQIDAYAAAVILSDFLEANREELRAEYGVQ